MMQVKHATDETHKSIGVLQFSGDGLKQKISDLSARREALLAALKQVEDALTQAQQEESQLPDSSTRTRCPSPQSTADEGGAEASGGFCR